MSKITIEDHDGGWLITHTFHIDGVGPVSDTKILVHHRKLVQLVATFTKAQAKLIEAKHSKKPKVAAADRSEQQQAQLASYIGVNG